MNVNGMLVLDRDTYVGLPERAAADLRAWLREHLNPPDGTDPTQHVLEVRQLDEHRWAITVAKLNRYGARYQAPGGREIATDQIVTTAPLPHSVMQAI